MGACVLARTWSLPFCKHSFLFGRLSEVHRYRRQALLVHHSLQRTCCSSGPLFAEPTLFKSLGRSSQASMALSSSVEPPSQHKSSFVHVNSPKINFCSSCGGPTEERIPNGEERPRAVCTVCGVVHYQNPKMVVGCLVIYEDKILLCKRKIEPCSGLWTLPAGYMELGESAVEGAVRETWEEANAEVDVQAPFAQLDIPVIGQSYIIFRAKLRTPHFSPGSETLECALFGINEIPFDQIAFSSTTVVLKLYMEDLRTGEFKVHHGVIEKRPGSSASSGYTVRDHICI